MSWKTVKFFFDRLWTTTILGLILLLLFLGWISRSMMEREFPSWVPFLARHVIEVLGLFTLVAMVHVWWQPAFIARWHEKLAWKTSLIVGAFQALGLLLLLSLAAMGIGSLFCH